MEFSRGKWSWYWLARNKPYWLILLTGLLLAASFPPSPLNYLIYIAFVPVFVLFETGIVPERQPEDTIFLPFKRVLLVLWRIGTWQWIWRKSTRGLKVFRYRRRTISGNAQLFRYSYSIFFIWNALCCYWLMLTALGANSVQVAFVNVMAGILAIALNPVLMSIPWQLHSRLRHFLAPELSALALCSFWIAFEYLHFNWELAWPWLTLGHALSFHPEMIQYAEFTGVLGISAQILLVNVLAYVAVRHMRASLTKSGISLLGAVLIFAAPYLMNVPLTNPARQAFQSNDSLRVRIIQPDLDPFVQRSNISTQQTIDQFVTQITSQPLDSGTIVLLPEKAIDQPLDPVAILKGRLMAPLWEIVDSYHVEILTGIEDVETYSDLVTPPISARQGYGIVGGKRKLVYTDHYNSALIMHADRSTLVYRKGHLVPMVERVPFLKGLRALKFLRIDPAKGMESYGRPDSIQLSHTQSGIPTNILICYESAFGDHTRRKTLMGAQWIAMITNDAWWRQSSGYVQHAGLCVIRAIENRRAIARCANNGRSMFVDARGEITQATDYSVPAVIEGNVPLYTYTTYYVRHGDYIGEIALGMSGILTLLGILLHYRRKKQKLDS
ncbi:MAG: apolipoprotein N-acyltransferase [Bacteroidetes bacterium]|nr:apolipoprotein N-acyltransferase [Bacteroidota bacterium]